MRTERLEPRLLLATVTGRVTDDVNVNGLADPGEGGAAGFTVYLDANANAVLDAAEPRALTDAAGDFVLDTGTATGTFWVRLADRTGWGFTAPFNGLRTVTIPDPGGTHGNVDFLASTRSVFTGRIFHDLDNDRVMDAGEPPLEGWTVFVDLDHNNVRQANEPFATSGPDGVWSLNLNGAGPDPFHRHYHFVQPRPDGWARTAPAFTDLMTMITQPGRVVIGMHFGSRPFATVAGRHVFYNDSAFDGRDPAADARDDNAVAADKRALRPGDVATFDHVTSYSRGINGVIVDVAGLPPGAQPSADDFDVLIGSGSTWAPGPAPAVSTRPGAGAGGASRITLTWPEGAVRNGWLQVTVKATADTALAAPDVFAFGHLAGETGDAPPGRPHVVNVLDFARTRSAVFSDAPVTSRYDFNRDGRVSALDLAIVRANQGRRLFPPTIPAPVSPLSSPDAEEGTAAEVLA